MDWADQLSNINYWAVLLATLSSFAIGATWYAWGVFGKQWVKLVGLTKADVEKPKGMEKTYLLTAVGSFIAATTLAVLLRATSTEGVFDGLVFGAVLGIAFRLTSHIMHNGFARVDYKLSLIDGFHDTVQMAVMGAILGGLN